jgi:hypothetical protein
MARLGRGFPIRAHITRVAIAAGGSVYNEDVAETATASDSAAAAATFAAIGSESAAASETQTAAMAFGASVAETATGTDALSVSSTFALTLADSAAASDASTTTAALAGVVSETATASESATSTAVFLSSGTETATASDDASTDGEEELNPLDEFMAESNFQLRTIIKSDFTHVGESPEVSRLGTFGNAQVIPVMTRQGYEDHAVVFMEVERSLYATPPQAKGEILREETGVRYFVQAIDKSSPVLYIFTLTEREL